MTTIKDRIEYALKYADDIAWQYENTMYEAPIPWSELRQDIIVRRGLTIRDTVKRC